MSSIFSVPTGVFPETRLRVNPPPMDGSENQDLRRTIRQRRLERGWTQDQLARRVGTDQQTIGKIELGETKRSSFLPMILRELGLDLDILAPRRPQGSQVGNVVLQAGGERDLPVYGVAEGGASGALIVTTDPVEYAIRPQPLWGVRDAYGLIVVEDSMSPEFEPGDIALVHPHLPPRIGRTCVFYAEAADGTVKAMIKRLRRFTADTWHVMQHNPGSGQKSEFNLPRKEWQKCHCTVGRYNR